MKSFLVILISLNCLFTQAYEVKIHVYDSIKKLSGSAAENRDVAASRLVSDEENLLVYYSPDAKRNKMRIIDAKTWSSLNMTANGRLSFFLNIYNANIKDVSRTGQRHVGCFLGEADQVANTFFRNELPISNLQKHYLTVSEDAKLIGFEFDFQNFGSPEIQKGHFRLPHCIQGSKAPLIEFEQVKSANRTMPDQKRSIASTKNIRLPAALEGESGFEIYDKLNKQDEITENSKKLPRFKLNADYDRMASAVNNRPWKGMDISNEEGGRKFAHLVLDYFYDSLVVDTVNPEMNFIAQNTPVGQTQWCHMPWLNVGDSGRELIHGLTKERDLERSEIYPEVATTKEKEGSDWGIGFYNDIACATAFNVFGSLRQQAARPDFSKANFPDGSVSVKVLFTTAKLDGLKGAYMWTANVGLAKSTSRALRPVKMVQIDIAVKDSTLKGVRSEVDGWMMTTFYFDASYIAPSRHKYTNALAGLLKMRPIGIQTGFDPSTSLIFKDAKTNSANNKFFGAKPMLLNGPADNPKASCLSCHGAAGTSRSMVPGIRDFNDFAQYKSKGLDFSQQLALAKRNFETRNGQLDAAVWK